jgi:hypothetical protein
MTRQQIYEQASREWLQSQIVRLQYPTFGYFWQACYARIYNMDRRTREELEKETRSLVNLFRHEGDWRN